MNVVDCDAHVEESVETWSYLDPEFYLLRPLPVLFPEDTCFGSHNAGWVIDYKLRFFASNPTLMARAKHKDVPIPVQELRDVKQRLAYMDELGIDKQVVFPSIWLGCLAENIELEAALARSYNKFMAAQCAQSGGRSGMSPSLRGGGLIWRGEEIRRVKRRGPWPIFAPGLDECGKATQMHPTTGQCIRSRASGPADYRACRQWFQPLTISRMLEGAARPFR